MTTEIKFTLPKLGDIYGKADENPFETGEICTINEVRLNKDGVPWVSYTLAKCDQPNHANLEVFLMRWKEQAK
jgi:hypothetical protein